MKRVLKAIASILLLASSIAAADGDAAKKPGLDCTYLNQVPNAVIALSVANAINDRDSSPDICAKNAVLFAGLMDIERQLIRRYYTQDQMIPEDVEAIPRVARLQANLEYPIMPNGGCTMHDKFEDTYRMTLILSVILQSAHRIQDEANRLPPDLAIGVVATPAEQWDKSWTSAVNSIRQQLPPIPP